MAKRRFSLFQGLAKHHRQRDSWAGTTDELPLRAIECWKFREFDELGSKRASRCPRTIDLQDHEVGKWLLEDGPRDRTRLGGLNGHIRLLICHERQVETVREKEVEGRMVKVNTREPRFYMTRNSFEAAEEHLNLSFQTLPNLANIWGIQSSEMITESDGSICLDITMKSPDIPELPRDGISLSYNFATRTTTAFLRSSNAVRKDYDRTFHTFGSKFSVAISHTVPLWHHPLLLPVILLEHELATIREFSREKLRVDSENIRTSLKTTTYDEMAKLLGGYNDDVEAKTNRANFTQNVNSILCTAISLRRALQTTRRSAKFLLDLLEEIYEREYIIDDLKALQQGYHGIKDLLKRLDNEATGFEVGIEAIIATMEVQFDVLSTVASQLDSNRSAEMGAQAGMDSVAMKTLALVTAVFLPATFIAALFSMSVFDWQADPSSADGSKVVGDRFWIFWAASIPLTVVVLGSWWLWWDVSRIYYASRFKDADGERGTQVKAFKEWAKTVRKTAKTTSDAKPQDEELERSEGAKADNDVSGRSSSLPRSQTSCLEAGLSNSNT